MLIGPVAIDRDPGELPLGLKPVLTVDSAPINGL